MSTRFSQSYKVGHACEPASFWPENVIAIVILQRVLARMSYWRESYNNNNNNLLFIRRKIAFKYMI